MKLTELLEQVDRLDQEAEAAPWGHEPAVNTQNGWSLGTVRSDRTGESVAPEVYDPDGAFIALARTVLPQLAKAVKAVLDIHRPLADGSCDTCEGAWLYPCPTVRAITDAMREPVDGTR